MAKGDAIDLIASKIVVEAKDAIAELQNFNKEVQDSGKKLKSLQNIIAAVSQKMGGNLAGATKVVEKFVASFSNINPQVLKALGKELQTVENLSRKSLGAIGSESTESSVRINSLSAAIQQMAIKGKMSVDSVVRSLRTLNEYGGQSTQIGKLGFSGADISRAGELAAISLRRVEEQAKKAGDAGDKAGKKIKSAFEQVVSPINVARIAIGTFVSQLLFQATQAVTTFVQESIQQFTELEDSLFRIGAAEKVLSEAGVEVSVAGLKKGISELREELRIFSDEELTKLVGQLAVMTKELGFNEDQILALARATAIKNKVSIDDESLSQTASKIVTTMLTDQSKGAAGLGIALGDAAIEAKALQMGLLEAGESASDLSDKEKKLVKLQIILDSAAGDAQKFGEFLDTNSAKISENTAAWEDFQASFGGLVTSVIPGVTKILELLTGASDMLKALVPVWDTVTKLAIKFQGIFVSFQSPMDKLKDTIQLLKDIPKTFKEVAATEIPNLFAKMPDNAPEWFKNLYGEFLTDTETATAEVEELLNVDGDLDETLAEIDDKIRDIAIDAQHAKEDLAIALSQKQEDLGIEFDQKKQDIDLEYERKEEDAARDLARKIEDINRDAARDKEKVLEKARQEEQKAEEDHQLKLWELKMRYLMDLEDALHARDARQIIRLQREYELEKELLEKKKEQEDEERQQNLENELEDVELKRQEKLEEAQIEYEQKLADLSIAKARELEELNRWKAREEADLQTWYQRELEEIDRNVRQKIEKLLAGYIEEQKIHEEQQEAIHQILLKYFGKNMGLVDQLMNYTAGAFSNMAALAQSAFTYSQPFYDVPQLSQQGLDQYHNSERDRGFKHGGTLIATQPTTATFGEVPEMVSFTPLGHRGRDVGKLFGSGDMSMGEGRISLDINLSPDLRAQIIEDSMDGVADVIARVNNAKV